MAVNIEGNAIVKVDGQQAGQQIEKLEQKTKSLRAELRKVRKQEFVDEKKVKRLKTDLDKTNQEVRALKKNTFDYNKVLKNLSGASIRDLTKLQSKLNFEVKKYGRNTAEYKKAVFQLQKVKAEMAGVRNEMNAAIPKTNKFGMTLKSMGANLVGTLGITAGIGMLVGALSSFIKKAEVANELNRKVKNSFALQGKAARNVTADILALSDTFDVDYNEVLQTANTVSKEMGISAKQALSYIEEGFKKGSNNSGEFLDILKEYPTQFRAAGIDAKTMFAIINQQVKDGIYSDKGIDAIKEGGLRLRENTKATADSLKVLKASTQEQIKQEIAAGNSFEAIKLVSEALKNTSLTASETQSIIANVFGGPGEDAGLRYLQTLSDIDTNLENVKNQTSLYKDSTLELSKQYNKFVVSATEGNGLISESLAGVVDMGTDVLTVLTQFNDGGWSDKLKIVANTFANIMLLDKKYRFEVGKTAKELTKLTNQHFKIREVVEKKLTKEEIAALEKRKAANKKAYAEIQKEKEKQAKKEKAALQELYDFIEQKEFELADMDPFERKLKELDNFYEESLHKAVEANASQAEIDQLKELWDEERNKLKVENATNTEQAIFDMKKKYGLLTDEEILAADIQAFEDSQNAKLLSESERMAVVQKMKLDYAEKEKSENQKTLDAEKTARQKALDEEKKEYEEKAKIVQSFAEQAGQIMGDALADSNKTAKDAMKAFLIMSLDMLKRHVQLMIATAVTKEIGTKGFIGIGTGAVLTGLIEAAFGAAKGIINGFSEGGYTGPGQTQEVAGVVHKGEYVIPAAMMANSKIQSVVGALENTRTGGQLDYSGINQAITKGFADGGYTGASTDGQLDMATVQKFTDAVNNLVDRGVPAYVKDNTISDMRKRFKVHEEIERNSSL